MKYRIFALLLVLFIAFSAMFQETNAPADEMKYTQTVCPLERNGTALYLSQTILSGTQPQKQILLVHGVTYSSHEFNIDYQDYSLVGCWPGTDTACGSWIWRDSEDPKRLRTVSW